MRKLGLQNIDFTEQRIKQVANSSRQVQRQLAAKLMTLCGLSEGHFEGTLSDVRRIETTLNIEINVVCAKNFNSIIHLLRSSDKELRVYLYKNGNNYNTITSMTGFPRSSYYCHPHIKPYYNKGGCSQCKKDAKNNKNTNSRVCSGPKHPSETIF